MDHTITAAVIARAFTTADDPEPMCLPDCVLVGSTETDVRQVLGALHAGPWEADERSEDGTLSLTTPLGLVVDFFPTWGLPLQFDFDLRQLVDDRVVAELLDVLRFVAMTAGKAVEVRSEGDTSGRVVIAVSAAGAVVLDQSA